MIRRNDILRYHFRLQKTFVSPHLSYRLSSTSTSPDPKITFKNPYKPRIAGTFAVIFSISAIGIYKASKNTEIDNKNRIHLAKLQQQELEENESLKEAYVESLLSQKVKAAFATEENPDQSASDQEVKSTDEPVDEAPTGIDSESKETSEEPVEIQVEEVTEETLPSDGNPFPNTDDRTPEAVDADIQSEILSREESSKQAQSNLEESTRITAAAVKSAIQLEETAAKAVMEYTALLRIAMDEQAYSHEQQSENWQTAAEALQRRESARKLTIDAVKLAREKLLAFKALINSISSSNPEISDDILRAEDWYSEMTQELNTSIMKTAVKLSEANVLAEYSKVIQESRDKFQKELFAEENLPDDIVKIKEGWMAQADKPRLENDELNALLAHSYRQINALKEELKSEREKISDKMSNAIEGERSTLLAEATKKIELETEQRFIELKKQYEERIFEVKKRYEDEVIVQLKRQTAAHVGNVTDIVKATEVNVSTQLHEIHTLELAEIENDQQTALNNLANSHANDIFNLTVDHETQLAKCSGILDGTNAAISVHALVENQTNSARKLALAVRSFATAVRRGNASVQKQLDVIRAHGDETTIEIIDRISEKNTSILSRGVIPQRELKQQFFQLIAEARDCLYVPEESNILSRTAGVFQSKIMYLARMLPSSLKPPAEIEVDAMSSADMLAYATYCVENGNLEQASRFLAQVNGDAARIVDSWVTEACRLVEFRKASKAISAIADAISLSVED